MASNNPFKILMIALMLPLGLYGQHNALTFNASLKGNYINLSIENYTDTDVYIDDISCYGIVLPSLIYDHGCGEGSVPYKIKIKPNLSNCDKIYLPKGGVCTKVYNRKLDELFDIDTRCSYVLQMIYNGKIYPQKKSKGKPAELNSNSINIK